MVKRFDPSRVTLRPLTKETHATIDMKEVGPMVRSSIFMKDMGWMRQLKVLVKQLKEAKRPPDKKKVVWFLGPHVIKLGLSRLVIELMREGWIDHLAISGSFLIHDYEMARFGQTGEDVPATLSQGQFGLYEHLQDLNEVLQSWKSRSLKLGLAERLMSQLELDGASYPRREDSILYAAQMLGVSVSAHVGIGLDVCNMVPNYRPDIVAQASYMDFRHFAALIGELQDGVFMNYGSAVTGPEVFLKALSMVRNVTNGTPSLFTTAAFDLRPCHPISDGSCVSSWYTKESADYHNRPKKTVVSRATGGKGVSLYINADHRDTLPALVYYLQDI